MSVLLTAFCGMTLALADDSLPDRDPVLERPLFFNIPADVRHLIHEDATATVIMRISEDGEVVDWVPLRVPHPRLIRPLEVSLSMADFQPAILEGEPVTIDIIARIPVGKAGYYGIITETVAEHIESRLSRINPDMFQVTLSKPGQLDSPLKLVSEGQPLRVVDDDGNLLAGKVIVEFYIDATGQTRLARPVSEAHPALQVAAVRTLEGFIFEPPRRNGKPTIVRARIPIEF